MNWQTLTRALALLSVCLAASTTFAGLFDAKPLMTAPAATQPADGSQTGPTRFIFTERSPLSELTIVVRRMGWNLDQLKTLKSPLNYSIEQESFEAYVPPSYDGTEPFGLFVWVNAGPTGNIPERWFEVFDKHKLIAVSPNNAGNNREVWNRMGVALDAAPNMKARYKIDPSRVYVSGVSGGGKTASHLALGFPDVFRGGLYVVGVNYFRNVPVGTDPKRAWPAGFVKPRKDLFKLVTTRSRHVLLTGDTDMNRQPTHDTYEAFKADGFKYVTYLQVPEMGHGIPDAEWFEKGIAALDEPLGKIAPELDREEYKEPSLAKGTVEKAGPPKVASAGGAQQQQRAPVEERKLEGPAAEAERELRGAKLYLNDRRLYPKARERLKKVVDAYPNTPAADEAVKLLKSIEGK